MKMQMGRRGIKSGFILAMLVSMALLTACASVSRPPASSVEIQKPRPAYLTLKASPLSLVNPADDQGRPYPITFTAKILGGESLEWCVTAVNWYFEELQRTPSHQETGCMDRIFQTTWSYHTTGMKTACIDILSNESVASRVCTTVRIGVPLNDDPQMGTPAVRH